MLNLAILGSGNGNTLIPIVNAIKNKKLNAKIVIIISDCINAGILKKATKFQIKKKYILSKNKEMRKDFDKKIHLELQKHKLDLIVMIGYMRIVSHWFIKKWKNRIINVHPSLLPKYSGLMDLQVHKAVLKAKEKKTGCTVHFVEKNVDTGYVLKQASCSILKNETPESLKIKIQKLEGKTLINVINEIQTNNYFNLN